MTHKLKCIMLIDDDEDDNFFHKREIADNHLADMVIVQDSAIKALEYLKAKTDPCSDLIFLDINMPRMNGWEFLTEYNKLDKEMQSKAIIIMLSTSENPSDIARAKSWDFVADYITK
ncbi:MAG TPA: response regulator, partial [Bacteroidia bacterium]|nr:response regulator [Bacteroidia bacterium]